MSAKYTIFVNYLRRLQLDGLKERKIATERLDCYKQLYVTRLSSADLDPHSYTGLRVCGASELIVQVQDEKSSKLYFVYLTESKKLPV